MQYLGVSFSVAGAAFLFYLLFVAGANFFPDAILASGGFYPKPIYETNFAIFLGVFHFSFLLAAPIIFQKIFSNILATPPRDPKTP